jgi:membrane fusion protein, multidrug efflux system
MEHVAPNEESAYRDGYRDGFRDGTDQGSAKKQEEAGGADEKDGHKKAGGRNGKQADQKHKPLYKRPLVVAIALAVVLALLIAGIILWRHSRSHETTDDAFVDGYTGQIAAQTGGRVLKLYVVDNQLVHAGDPLLDIDPRDNDARRAQARSQLASAKGQYEQAQAQIVVSAANADQADAAARQSEADWRQAANDLARYRTVDPDAVSHQQIDTAATTERGARAKLDAARQSASAARAQVVAARAASTAARSQIETADAALAAAELQSSYTHVVAPITGHIARRAVDVGNVISTGQPLLAVVSEELWVTANYKETQLAYMRRGQPVDIKIDAFPHLVFRGQIDSIQRSTGAYFSSLPAENATGNYVKVVQRVPVKILFVGNDYQKYAIGPGMSVEPNVTVH